MSSNDEKSSSVTIGNVSGGIHGSVIAGRDVSKVTITLGGQPVKATEEPSEEKLKQLLAEIQAELAEVLAGKEMLSEVDPSSPFTAQGAEASINAAAKIATTEESVEKEQAESMQKSLTNATGLLNSILDGAKTAAEKAGEVGKAAKPIAEALAPLVEKLAVASFWVGRLWLGM